MCALAADGVSRNLDRSNLRLSVAGSVATIWLDRPHKLNAMHPDMLVGLETLADELECTSDVRAVILTSVGERAFSVGADIDAWSALAPLDMWRNWVLRGHRVFDRFARLRQPLIAALNGRAFGGGLELALTADLRLAAPHVELAMPEVKLATLPGWGGTQRLSGLVGPARAKQMVLTGARIDATTAERWGLVNEVVGADELLTRASTLAEEIAANAPVAVQLAKQVIGAAASASSATLEAVASALAASTADGREGVAAFRERRAPRFIGS